MELGDLLRELISRDGSDLHLIVGQPPTYRVDGALVRTDAPPLDETVIEALLRERTPRV